MCLVWRDLGLNPGLPDLWQTLYPQDQWNGSHILGKTTRHSDNKKKKEKEKGTCRILDFAVPIDHRLKLKESEKKYNYLYVARELKKMWNMKMTVSQIVIGTLDRVIKGLEDLLIRGYVETIQTTALLRPARILRRICCHLNSCEKPSANAGMKNPKRNGINYNNRIKKSVKEAP